VQDEIKFLILKNQKKLKIAKKVILNFFEIEKLYLITNRYRI